MSGAKAKIISHIFQTVKNIRSHSVVNCEWKFCRTGLDQFRNEASGQGIDAGNPDDFIFSVEVRDGLF